MRSILLFATLALTACTAPAVETRSLVIDSDGSRKETITTSKVTDESYKKLQEYYFFWPFLPAPKVEVVTQSTTIRL